jgi:hypothetical protein
MGYLRLAHDSLSMIDTDGSLDEGTTVSFTVPWTGLALWSIGGVPDQESPGLCPSSQLARYASVVSLQL